MSKDFEFAIKVRRLRRLCRSFRPLQPIRVLAYDTGQQPTTSPQTSPQTFTFCGCVTHDVLLLLLFMALVDPCGPDPTFQHCCYGVTVQCSLVLL